MGSFKLYFLYFLNIWLMINAQTRIFGGITAVQGEVHIDFLISTNTWQRYVVGNSKTANPYKTSITNTGEETTWIYTEGTNGMRFESKSYPGYYLAAQVPAFPAPQLPPFPVILIKNDLVNVAEWIPKDTGTPGQATLQNLFNSIACLHSDYSNKWYTASACNIAFRIITKVPTSGPTQDPTPAPTKNPTPAPTNNPTPSPTKNPTPAPTTNPTPAPTNNPTTDPTHDPTADPTFDPTADPTFDPTIDPTTDPTIDPTIDPTADPTIDPTSDPTSNPTVAPINKPTIQNIGDSPTESASGSVVTPTVLPTTEPTATPLNGVGAGANATSIDTERNVFFQYMTAFLAAFLGLVIVLSYIYSKWMYKNDFYRVGALITASLHILDMVSDVSFALQVTVHPLFATLTSLFIIFVGSIIFILMPLSLSLYQLHCVTNSKWMKSSNELRGWIHDNIKILYFLSVLTGSSFTGIELCHSNLFNLTQFDIPLSKTELSLFKTQRIYSVIALENVPQIALQAWYIAVAGNSAGDIVYISMAFSFISIVIAVISMFTQKTIINMMDYVVIQFDVYGSDVSLNMNYCQNIIKKPQQQIAIILGVNKNITEMARPTSRPNGLTVEMKVYISISKAIDLNCDKLINDAKNNGQLANIFKSSWSLKSTPKIENIKCKLIHSKRRTNNTVNISVANTDHTEQDSNEIVQIAMNEIIKQHNNNKNNASEGHMDNATDINTDNMINMNALPVAPHVVTDYGQPLKQINSYDSDSSSTSNHDQNGTKGNNEQ